MQTKPAQRQQRHTSTLNFYQISNVTKKTFTIIHLKSSLAHLQIWNLKQTGSNEALKELFVITE